MAPTDPALAGQLRDYFDYSGAFNLNSANSANNADNADNALKEEPGARN
jgi:hypothetical protein